MSNESEKPKPPKEGDKKVDKQAEKPAKTPEPAKPVWDERKLKLAELVSVAKLLDVDELVELARDGRGIVRANAALGLAAVGHPAFELVTLIRDSEPHVAMAAAEAVARLGTMVRALIPQLVGALDSAQPEVLEAVIGSLSQLIGSCDEELAAALDVPESLALKTVVAAAGRLGARGIQFLAHATGHDRSRVRVNAIAGLGRHGKIDPDVAMACLTAIEVGDPVPDVRTAAKHAMLAVVAREKTVAVDTLPAIPDFEARKLSKAELMEHEGAIDLDQMIHALQDGRAHVKINAARALGLRGDKAARAASALGLLLRDSVPSVRREVALALGKLGTGASDAAAELVGALGDGELDVAEAAGETITGLGQAAREALVRGLDAGVEIHGIRVGELLGKLPDAAKILTEAFRSPAVNVQVNAALGLGLLRAKVGTGLAALHGARTGGDARTRDAVRRALEMIDPKGDSGPKAITIDGFEDRFLSAADVDKTKAALEQLGVDELVTHLTDGRDIVRANAATALGALGAAAAGAARSLGVRLRDDAARVRIAAAQALDRIGDAAVVEVGGDLVGALRDPDDKVADVVSAILRSRKTKMITALVRGLETDDERHGRRIVQVINALPEAAEILADAFESPAVNVQVNAVLGMGLLGNDRVGKGRRALEGARTGGWERTRDAVKKALELLDGPRAAGPAAIEIDGFETRYLAPDAFKDAAKLPLADLVTYLTDGRAIVRANAATALGAAGAAAAGAASSLGVLLRDDDPKVRIAAAGAIDKLGDDAVKELAGSLVGALRGDAEVAKAAAAVLAARKTRVLTAMLKGLETDDETHARRILELIGTLPDAAEILIDAIDSPAENVQVNAAIGIGMLGAKRAGTSGRKALETRRTGGFPRTREAVFKGLALLDGG